MRHRSLLSLLPAIALLLLAVRPTFAGTADTPQQQPQYEQQKATLFEARQGLGNVFTKLDSGETVNVAYLGGSITAANGWRVKTTAALKKKYPNATINEIHAAIGGTGSDLGVFRLGHDVLQYQPDLLFVEFAVNDGGASPERIWQAMEGIVRQTWQADPTTGICFIYTFRVGYETDLQQGVLPRAASAMEQLAQHYSIPTVNVALPIVELEQDGKLIFKSDEPTPDGVIRFSSDGVHPLDAGHEIYTTTIMDAMTAMKPESRPIGHAAQLDTPYVADNWEAACMVPLKPEMLTGDWEQLPEDDTLQRRFGNRMGTIWEAGKPGSRLSFRFRGSQAKLYDLLGPDGGQVIITVDGETNEKPVPRFDSYCTYHRIATLTLCNNLDPKVVHRVTVEIHPEQPDRSSVAFRLQDPEKELQGEKFQGTKIRVSQVMLIGEVVE